MNGIDPTSRYADVPLKTYTLPDGREVNYFARRLLPQPGTLAEFGRHVVRTGDRLDTVAAQGFGDPTLFWRLVDAHRDLVPRALVAALGRSLRLTLPAGFPGGYGA